MPTESYSVMRSLLLLVILVCGMSINGQFYAFGEEVIGGRMTTTTESTTTESTTTRPINLFIVSDVDNDIVNKSVTNSLKSTRDQYPDWLGKVVTVMIDGTDPKDILEHICAAWDSALQEGPTEIPDLVLDTTRTGLGAETVNSFTAALGIPTLSAQFGQDGDLRYWRDLTGDQHTYLVQVMPPADLIPELIRSLALQSDISNLAVIFDENFVMDHKYKSLLLNAPTRHVIVRVKNSTELISRQLSQLRKLDIVNYFVLGSEDVITAVLDAGQSLNYTGFKYGWYALTQDDFTPRCDCKNLSLMFFKPIISVASQQRLEELVNRGSLPKPILASAFYYDLVRIGVAAMRSSIKDGTWPLEPKQMTCDSYNGQNTPWRNFNFFNHLTSVEANMGIQPTFAGFKWGKKNGENHASFNMSISMIVISNGNAISTEELGTWPAGESENWSEIPAPDKMKRHIAVTSYRIVTVEKPPFMMYDPEKDEWSGYCIDLLGELQDLLNFTYDIYIAPDKKFGSMDKYGNWNGMIRELQEKRADFALGALSVMAERENVVDFTVPYYDLVGLSILMRKPKSPTSLFKFLTVLENDVWLCILGSYFFTSFLMWIFDRWSPYSYQNNREKYRDDDDKREFDLKECLWFCMTSLTPQGGGEAPKNLSGRIVAATWWLFGFIIIASYTANLAAFLTISRLDTPVESLTDLSRQYKVQYAPIWNSEAHTYFKRMAGIEGRFYEIWKDMSLNDSMTDLERAELAVWDYPVSDKYTKMFLAMNEAKYPSNLEEALLRIRRVNATTKNEFALVGDAVDVRYLAMTNCDLVMVGQEFSKKPYAIAVQQGSPLKDKLNNAILTLLNLRRLERFKNKWWLRNPNKKTCEKEEDQSEGIGIQNIGGVFIVIFVGIGLACVTLVFEYWWYRYLPMWRAKRNANRKDLSSDKIKPVRFNIKPAKAPDHDESKFKFRGRF